MLLQLQENIFEMIIRLALATITVTAYAIAEKPCGDAYDNSGNSTKGNTATMSRPTANGNRHTFMATQS